MKKNLEKTKVVFRAWKNTRGGVSEMGSAGGVIALFPELDEGRGRCSSYEHVGQHSEADYDHVIRNTRPAKPHEYRALDDELSNIGYNLLIRSRR
ncbi:MAG: hypothetical protein ABIE47_06635 [Pseudomonadota bacterium]